MEQLIIRINERSSVNVQSFTHWLNRGREWWKTRPGRAIEAENLVVVDADNTVVAIGKIEGIRKDISNNTGRISIEVIPDPNSEWLGKVVERGNSRNPVSYVQELIRIDGPQAG